MKKDYLYYIIIIILPFLFFINLIDINKIIADKGDLTQISYPYLNFTSSMLNTGEIPLWNPYSTLGEPFAGNIQAQIFYPINNILCNIFPLNFALTISLIFHVIIAGLFIYFICKDFGLNENASLFSSITFMLNTYFLNKIANHIILCTIIYIPVIFYFFKKSLEKKSIKYSFITGFFLGMSWLAGFAQITLYTSFILLLFYIFYEFKNKISLKLFLKSIKFLIIPLIFSVALAAVQLFPFLELSSLSVRSNGVSYDFATVYSMSVHNFLTLFTPNFFGNGINLFYWLKGSAFSESTIYLGVITLFLIIFAFIFKKKEKYCQFFIILMLISAFLSFGKNNPFYYLIYKLPLFNSFRVPSKFLVLFMFSASILAGYGFQFLSQKITKNNKILIKKILKKSIFFILIFFIISGISLLITIYNYFQTLNINVDNPNNLSNTTVTYSGKSFSIIEILKNSSIDLILFIILFIISWFFIIKIINGKLHVNYLIILLLLNLFFYNFNTIFKIWDIENIEPPKELDYFKKDLGLFRYYEVYNDDHLTSYNIISKYYSIDSANVIELQYLANFFSKDRDYRNYFNIDTNMLELLTHEKLNLMGVKYIFSQSQINYNYYDLINKTNEFYIYKNNKPLPRTFIYSNKSNSETCNLLNEELNNINNISLKNYCLFDYSNITYYSLSKVIININSNISGYLVLTDTYYPGWKVYVDGKEENIDKILEVFRAVKIDKNTKEVIFSYEPNSFKLGLLSTLFSLVIFITILIL
jgi:membrane protein YfhO